MTLWLRSLCAADFDPKSTDWWSLKKLTNPEVPSSKSNSVPDNWRRSPIDAFVFAGLSKAKLQPSPEADAVTLIRRVYFDLIGLPPRPEEVDAFVEAFGKDREAALENLVDRLLASPQYGERWARHWLDVVHYGDTHGYDKDKPRPNAWPYRDYVIRAFNDDKPYARFVQEQIAGDVLFPGTRDGIEALGFIAAGPWDFIGHAEVPETKIDGKVARHLDRDDMVMNTIETFNSLTVQCAQCHDHKFDPISQEDYYSLQAVFAAVDRTDVKYYADEKVPAKFRELQRRQTEISNSIAAVEQPLKRKAGEAFAGLNRRIQGASVNASKKQGNSTPDFGYHSGISPTHDATKWVQVDLGQRVSIERVELQPCYDDFNNIGAGFGFPVRFKIEASDDPEFKSGVTLLWRKHDATFMNDFPNPKLRTFVSNGAKDDGISGRYVRVTAAKLAPRKNDYILALAELRVFDQAGTNVALGKVVTALDSIEAPPRWRKTNLTDGLAPETNSADERQKLIEEREALLLSVADEVTQKRWKSLQSELRAVAEHIKKLPPANIVYAGSIHNGNGSFRGTGPDGGKPRTIYLLNRGDVRQPGKEMAPGSLGCVEGLPSRFTKDGNEGERRAALAKWLSDPRNPLTWRSIVNRVWQQHFGLGLVDTPNDFGRMGAKPSNPELLDWLAVTFRDHMGGSLKKLHKLIVMSAAYRQVSLVISNQSSVISGTSRAKWTDHSPKLITDYSAAIQTDPENRLLWRQNSRKLDAESIRDSVLFVSGKLDPRMGGPAFQDFVVEKPEHSPHYEYRLHDPDDAKSHRRSIYRFIVRSQMQPFMTTLDCADPSIQVGRRNESLSALQALAMLNDGLMVTMSKHFAEKLEAQPGDLSVKVELGFKEALGRTPTAAEKQSLTDYANQHGLANACRLLFNLNEFAFVD